MSRYIDADELIKLGLQDGAYEYVSVDERAHFPTADVRENVKGEWIEDGAITKCSVCGNTSDYCGTENFCHNCGADMRSQ